MEIKFPGGSVENAPVVFFSYSTDRRHGRWRARLARTARPCRAYRGDKMRLEPLFLLPLFPLVPVPSLALYSSANSEP